MRHHSGARRQRGLAVALTSLALIPLMIFAAFGVDLAGWYSRISYLQRAADAAALAGTVWMPNLTQATTEATASLRSNGIVDGVDGIDVVIERGSTPTSLRVELTDTDADRFFSRVLGGGNQSLTRHAEAEYKLPLPLGSPLNIFGGDASKTAPTPVFSYSVNWPSDYATRPPRNPSCNVGTASAQGLGGWSAGSPPTYSSSAFSGSTQCRWTVNLAAVSGSPSSTPPVDWGIRVPTNGTSSTGCRVMIGSTIYGRWQSSAFSTSTGGSAPACTWNLVSTLPASVPSFASSVAPSNRPCRVGYELSRGFWPNAGAFQPSPTAPTTPPLPSATHNGYRLCEWNAGITTTDVTPPNPIDRSQGYWAQIHGPGADKNSGDSYSPRCVTAFNCGTPDNPLYTAPSDPNQGYWYVVKVPPGGGGQTVIRIFDAQLTSGALDVGAGDSTISGSSMSFNTEYRVYRQTNPLDFNSRVPVTGSGANQTPNSCNWSIQTQSAFHFAWVDLCTINTVANEIYLVNVRTSTISGVSNSAGRNGYAIEACLASGCTGSVQPAVYAFEKMVMYFNQSASSPTFYIAEVGPQYAGRTLVLELWDPGESSGQTWMYPMMPSVDAGRPDTPISPSICSFESTRAGYPRTSPNDLNNGGICGIRTSDGSALYNGHWVTMRIDIPTAYTCTPGVDPETTGGSCWWGIKYTFTGTPTDTTTWQARIEGNPLQLTE